MSRTVLDSRLRHTRKSANNTSVRCHVKSWSTPGRLYYDEHIAKFRIDNVPHKFGTIGSLGIVITDRPENLGVTIGTDDGTCGKPFVYSFDNSH